MAFNSRVVSVVADLGMYLCHSGQSFLIPLYIVYSTMYVLVSFHYCEFHYCETSLLRKTRALVKTIHSLVSVWGDTTISNIKTKLLS